MDNLKSILMFVSRIPSRESRQAEKFFSFLSGLQRNFTVDCLNTQSLFLDDIMVQRIRESGVNTINMRKPEKKIPFENCVESLVSGNKYDCIYFDQIYTAKYYFYYLKKFTPESAFVIDARFSQYLMDLKFLKCGRGDWFELPEKAVISREKEIPLYSCFDAVIVEDEIQQKAVKKEITKPVINISETRDFGIQLSELVPEKNVYDEGEIGIISYESSEGGEAVKKINSLLLSKEKNKYYLIIPSGAHVPEYFNERLLISLKSHRKNRVAVPLSEYHLSQQSGKSIPSPDKTEYFGEFLRKHLIGNFAEWRVITNIREPCILIRSCLVEEIGLLDDSYCTLFYSLSDYGFKVLLAGYRIIQNREAFIHTGYSDFYSSSGLYCDQRKLIDKWGILSAEFLEKLTPICRGQNGKSA